MSMHKPTVVLKRFFGNSLSEICLRHLQSFLVAFNEQVQNIEKSKASFLEDRKSKNMLWQTQIQWCSQPQNLGVAKKFGGENICF